MIEFVYSICQLCGSFVGPMDSDKGKHRCYHGEHDWLLRTGSWHCTRCDAVKKIR